MRATHNITAVARTRASKQSQHAEHAGLQHKANIVAVCLHPLACHAVTLLWALVVLPFPPQPGQLDTSKQGCTPVVASPNLVSAAALQSLPSRWCDACVHWASCDSTITILSFMSNNSGHIEDTVLSH
jgi:hypothetical protein